jgi:hypothetical protein
VLATLLARLLRDDELAQAVREDIAAELHRCTLTRGTGN